MLDICKAVNRSKDKLVQLCLPIEKAKATEMQWPMYGSEKLDGVYVLAVKDESEVKLFSRTGELYTSMKHIEEEMIKFMEYINSDVVIAEAYCRGISQPTISGWVRDKKNQHTELIAYVHDTMTFDEFAGKCYRNYEQRYEYMWEVFGMMYDDFKYITLIPSKEYNNMDEVMADAETIWLCGGEGIVLRNPKASYHAGKRDSSMLKVKKALTFDLEVVGVVEGKGKYENAIGKILCRDSQGKEIAVGSGLNDEERFSWMANPALIIGRIVEVGAMAISAKGLLREPRYKGVRSDKFVADAIA